MLFIWAETANSYLSTEAEAVTIASRNMCGQRPKSLHSVITSFNRSRITVVFFVEFRKLDSLIPNFLSTSLTIPRTVLFTSAMAKLFYPYVLCRYVTEIIAEAAELIAPEPCAVTWAMILEFALFRAIQLAAADENNAKGSLYMPLPETCIVPNVVSLAE